MDIILIIVGIVAFLMILLSLPFMKRKKKVSVLPLPGSYRTILLNEVEFYIQLDESSKIVFENRVQQFLSKVVITGVKTDVEDQDRILIAASAIIPIFGFPDWEYINVDEILLYPDSFNHEFDQKGGDRNILGMVGSGAYEDVMIISRHELRQGFLNKTGKTNTAIHEFVHLVDKTDGTVDGIPESLMARKYVLPWLELMQKEMKKIMANRSDINPYGATNQGEFFAVVAEYFFERPDLLQSKHPELYELLSAIFRQHPPQPQKR